MITPAISTPAAITGSECLILISNKSAMRAPVQAPVPGNGMPTNNNKPHKRYF